VISRARRIYTQTRLVLICAGISSAANKFYITSRASRVYAKSRTCDWRLIVAYIYLNVPSDIPLWLPLRKSITC